MAPSLVQDNVASLARDNSNSGTSTVTFTKATAVNHLVVLVGCQSGTATASSIATDSRGNTWQIDKVSGGQGVTANIFSCFVTVPHQVGDTVVITWSGSSTYSACIASEWTGIKGSSWRDQVANSSGVSGTPTTGVTGSRAQASELLIGAVGHNDATDYTAGTGIAWTLLTVQNTGAGNRKISGEYFIAGSTGTDAATWVGSLTNYCAAISTYKAAAAPANTVAPAVTGTTTVGQVLSTTNGTWTNDGGTAAFTYQWQRDVFGNSSYSNIGSATAATYTLVDADDACHIRCNVTNTDGGGATTQVSNVVGTVVEPAPANTVAPVASGSTTVGSTVSTTNGTWTGMGGHTATFTYQWQRDVLGNGVYSNIVAATSSSYVLVILDDACNVRCVVTATNDTSGVSANSNSILDTTPVPGGGAGINMLLRGVG